MDIFIVDDHPFIIEAYKNAIKAFNSKDFYSFNIVQAKDCRTGYEAIVGAENPFGIAFFDLSMPAYAEKQMSSGEDLAALLQQRMPECKIILLTMHSEQDKINALINNIDPNGLIIKNDLTFDELLVAFEKIIKGESYYSQTVVKLVAQSQYEFPDIDQFDQQILYQMSKGIKTKDIPQYLPLSLNTVEKRKVALKQILATPDCDDKELIAEAKNKGII